MGVFFNTIYIFPFSFTGRNFTGDLHIKYPQTIRNLLWKFIFLWTVPLNAPALIYSEMQSDGNSFYGDVVMDSLIMTSWDEGNILDQIYIKAKCVRVIIMMILFLKTLYKIHINTTVARKPNFMSSLLLCAVFLLICIFLNHF